MKVMRSKSLRVLLAAVLAFGLAPSLAYADGDAQEGSTASASSESAPMYASGEGSDPVYVEGEVLVAYDAAYSSSKIASLMDAGELSVVSSLSTSQEIVSSEDDQVIARVELKEGVSVEDAVAKMEQDALVEYAQPNFLYHLVEGQDLVDAPDSASESDSSSAQESFADDAYAASQSDASSKAAEASGEAEGAAAQGAQQAVAGVWAGEQSAALPLATKVNDPYANVATDDTANENQWWLYSVNAFDAWDVSRGNHDVTVAVLDTGINFEHEDLRGNIDFDHAYDAEAGTKLTKSATQGHGTHVAGIIAAEANNGIGFAGASYNANILPVNVFYYDAGYGDWYAKTETLIKAYQYLKGLVNNGTLTDLHVINMSLGGYGTKSSTDVAFEREIGDMNALGVMTVCAGGNGDEYGNPITSPSYPGDYDACVSVVALDSTDTRASWADYNQYKDISAPGVAIWSTWIDGANATQRASGTSMASPLVAGCVALLFAAQPNISVEDAKQALYSSAKDLGTPGWDQYYGWGKVDAAAMLATLRGATIKVDTEELYVTQSAKFSAELYTNQENDPATGTDWTWSVDKPSIATISADGTLTALQPGTVKVKVASTVDPTVTGSQTIVVKPIAIPNGITVTSAEDAVQIGWLAAPAATGYDVYRARGNASAANWEKIATVNAQSGETLCSYADSSVEVRVPYYYYVVPFGTLDGEPVYGNATADVVTIFKTSIMEYAGDTRYSTMEETVNMYTAERTLAGKDIDTVIVASGESFPDALAASGLAGIQEAPIVLTSSAELSESAASALLSVDPSKVIVLGGTAAISDEVVSQIKAQLPSTSVRRVYGETRVDTALKIYDEGKGSWGATAFIAAGDNSKFADSLSVSSYTYATKSPLFLVDSTSPQGLTASALQRLRSGKFDRVVIVGGTASVPQSVERQLTRLGISCERWAGDTRYETSQVIAQNGIAEGVLNVDEIGIATGQRPWDALSAGPLLGMQKNPLLLMDETADGSGLSATQGLLAQERSFIDRLTFFGGTASVPQSVRDAAAVAAGIKK